MEFGLVALQGVCMDLELMVAGIAALALIIYLLYALLYPERI